MPDLATAFSPFAETIRTQKYAHLLPGGQKETWAETARRVATEVIGAAPKAPRGLALAVQQAIEERKFIPGGRYLYATGRPLHQTQNCLLTRAVDSREGWATHLSNYAMGLMSGAGIGTVYSDIRPEGAPIRGMGGQSTGPLALMDMSNECGRGIMQGGSRRSAIWAGLHWSHPDCLKFIRMKDWDSHTRSAKETDYSHPARMDHTNISVILDDEFFLSLTDGPTNRQEIAREVYWSAIRRMLKTGEPGFSVDCGPNSGEHLRNACTEITSRDSDDICNLGSINLARVASLAEMHHLVEIGTLFLLAGTLYSHLPYPAADSVRSKNRRLGLGLMGIHDWLLQRGKRYEPDGELEALLGIYSFSGQVANEAADAWGTSRPVKTRAIAPTGSIGILAETTTGIEPIFCTAYKRRYLDGKQWKYQYVVDPTAARLIASGISPDQIEDATSLAGDVERRLAFQQWVQQYVDHGISSTINLPAWEANREDGVQQFGELLLKYLPTLRGCTVYPNGARGGQPLQAVQYSTAMRHPGEVFMETTDVCDLTRGGSCGS